MATKHQSKSFVVPKLEIGHDSSVKQGFVGRLVAELLFVINTFKEAFLHPMSTSQISKKTGKVVARKGIMLE